MSVFIASFLTECGGNSVHTQLVPYYVLKD